MRFWLKVITFMVLGCAALAIGVMAAARMTGRDGQPAALFATCAEPLQAGVIALVAIALLALLGWLAARLVGRHAGHFVIGTGLLGWAAMSGNAVSSLQRGGSWWFTLIESAAWSLLLLFLLLTFPSGQAAGSPSRRPRLSEPGAAARSWALGVIVLLPVIWIIARSELKGQTLAAACLASLVAALISRIANAHGPMLMPAVIPLVGGAGAAIARAVAGPLDPARIPQGWSPLLLVMPVDYAAGALLGGVVGTVWAGSLMYERPPPIAPQTLPSRET